jgi:hypothetical protein
MDQEVKKTATQVTPSRSQVLVDLADQKKGDELLDAIKGIFADDLRKAVDYANKNLRFKSVSSLEEAIPRIGFKVPAKAVTKEKKEKYTKKLEVVFQKGANADYRSFILGYLDSVGICINTKGDTYIYTFLPEKFERVVAKMKPVDYVTSTVIK